MPETLHHLRSIHLGNERNIWIRRPPHGITPAALAVFLDGELYRDLLDAPAAVNALEAEAAIPPVLCVYVSHIDAPTRNLECPCHPPFAAFVGDELMPWLERTGPHVRACRERVLVGVSYTGLAASYIAQQHDGLFTTIVSQSGSYWWNDEWLTQHYAGIRGARPCRFHLEAGLRETPEFATDPDDPLQRLSLRDAVRRFRDVIQVNGHEVHHHEFDGGHQMTCWQQTLPSALRWALGNR